MISSAALMAITFATLRAFGAWVERGENERMLSAEVFMGSSYGEWVIRVEGRILPINNS